MNKKKVREWEKKKNKLIKEKIALQLFYLQ